MTDAEIKALIDRHLDQLSEHFPNVKIFVTWPNEKKCGCTRSYYSGRGDFFATYGVIRQWLMAEDQSVRAQADIEAWDEHNGGDFGPNGN